jgi:hypothetical protein
MTTYMGVVAAVTTFLAFLGFVLAFTVEPNAINMGVGCLAGAPVLWGAFFAMRYVDRL